VLIQAEISRKWRFLPYKIAALRDAHPVAGAWVLPFRTTFRETLSSRQIALIVFC